MSTQIWITFVKLPTFATEPTQGADFTGRMGSHARFSIFPGGRDAVEGAFGERLSFDLCGPGPAASKKVHDDI